MSFDYFLRTASLKWQGIIPNSTLLAYFGASVVS